MREEVTHVLVLDVREGYLRVIAHGVVEIPAHGDDESAGVHKAAIRAACYLVDAGSADVV